MDPRDIINLYLGEFRENFKVGKYGFIPTWHTEKFEVWIYVDHGSPGGVIDQRSHVKLRGLDLTGNEFCDSDTGFVLGVAPGAIKNLATVSISDPDGVEIVQTILRRIATNNSVEVK